MASRDSVRNGRTGLARPDDAARTMWPDGPAFLRGLFDLPRSGNDNRPEAFDEEPADELDCLQRVLPAQLLRDAEAGARELGTGADQVLIQ